MMGPGMESNDVGKALFRSAKVENTENEQEDDNRNAGPESRPIRLESGTENAPPKSVDHTHHRIQGIPESPAVGHDTGDKADWADVEAHAREKRHNVLHVP